MRNVAEVPQQLGLTVDRDYTEQYVAYECENELARKKLKSFHPLFRTVKYSQGELCSVEMLLANCCTSVLQHISLISNRISHRSNTFKVRQMIHLLGWWKCVHTVCLYKLTVFKHLQEISLKAGKLYKWYIAVDRFISRCSRTKYCIGPYINIHLRTYSKLKCTWCFFFTSCSLWCYTHHTTMKSETFYLFN